MNERIKELKDQCWVEKRWTVRQDNGMWIEKHIDQEKFAQLIVEECAQRAEAYAYMSQNFVALAEELRRMKQNG